MNVLVVAPHPDDEAIGCGGAVALHVAKGDRVSVVFLTSGELGLKHLAVEQAWKIREREALMAAGILGIESLAYLRLPDWGIGEQISESALALKPILDEEAPELIYLPSERDNHPDHQASLPIVRTALEGWSAPLPGLRTYEIWSPLANYDHLEDITPVMTQKLRAIRCYQSQLDEFRYDRAIRGLNQYRGILGAKCRYAEVFQNVEATRPAV